MKSVAALVALIALSPFVLSAESDALRAQIRADLQKDSRTSSMSSVEFEALVSALAQEAEEQGTADAYLASQNSFDSSSLFPAPEAPSLLTRLVTGPFGIALFSFLAVLIVVALYIYRGHGRGRTDADA